jgi:hypothetical protein
MSISPRWVAYWEHDRRSSKGRGCAHGLGVHDLLPARAATNDGYRAAFIAVSVVCLLAVFLVIRLIRLIRKPPEEPDAPESAAAGCDVTA